MSEDELVKQLNAILDEAIAHWVDSDDALINEVCYEVGTQREDRSTKINTLRQKFNFRLKKLVKLNKSEGS